MHGRARIQDRKGPARRKTSGEGKWSRANITVKKRFEFVNKLSQSFSIKILVTESPEVKMVKLSSETQ